MICSYQQKVNSDHAGSFNCCRCTTMKRVYIQIDDPSSLHGPQQLAYHLHLYMFSFLGYVCIYTHTCCVVVPRFFFKRLMSEDCLQIRAMGRWQTYSQQKHIRSMWFLFSFLSPSFVRFFYQATFWTISGSKQLVLLFPVSSLLSHMWKIDHCLSFFFLNLYFCQSIHFFIFLFLRGEGVVYYNIHIDVVYALIFQLLSHKGYTVKKKWEIKLIYLI